MFDKYLKKVKLTPCVSAHILTLYMFLVVIIQERFEKTNVLKIYPAKSVTVTRFPSFSCFFKIIYIINFFKAIG